MLKTLMRTASWGDILQVLSPKFFRVFPTSQISSALGELAHNYRDADAFDEAVSQRSGALEQIDLPIRIAPGIQTTGNTGHEHGHYLLTLYFHQLFDDAPTLLDLRRSQYEAIDGALMWSPRPFYVDWDPDFITGIRDMYRGFYGDDEPLFESGLRQLELHGMGDVFLAHFGEGDQTDVTFDVDHFHGTFHDILARCSDQGRTLHRQFAALGAYLACLYDHMDQLDGSYNVRRAFSEASGTRA